MINYNRIAGEYDNRYKNEKTFNIQNELNTIIAENCYEKIAEIGCGTGHWLQRLSKTKKSIFGIDSAMGMLKNVKPKMHNAMLLCANANQLPVKKQSFDFIFCVNALHHFNDKKKFINDTASILMKEGGFAIVTAFPSNIEDKWYLYDFFPAVYNSDLKRFITEQDLIDLMNKVNLTKVSCKEIHEVGNKYYNLDVLTDPFLQKNGCSQMAMLSNYEYEQGISRINNFINLMSKQKKHAIFRSKIHFKIIFGKK